MLCYEPGSVMMPEPALRTILVVEDDADVRESLAELLLTEGFPVAVARDGEEALSRLHENPETALVLLDLMMPVMDGWAFRTRQNADPNLASIPVVVITALSPDERKREGLGDTPCLFKPVDVSRLLDMVRGYCA
jgi:CheY-like chemotaxis protein